MSSGLGTSAISPPFFASSSIPDGPALIISWVALIPLTIYLASPDHSRRLIGRIVLADAISVSFFPKLGVLDSIAQLMSEAPDFLDRACSIGDSRREVWDANWGSCFPCANGAVSEMVFANAIARAGKAVAVLSGSAHGSAESNEGGKTFAATGGKAKKPAFTRPQTLHVVRCTHKETRSHREMYLDVRKWVFRVVTVTVLLGIAVICCLSGMYGTMTAALISVALQVAGSCIAVVHPSSYLGDNEQGSVGQACMLVANHQNASTWYLFTGARGVVDGVLNKNMISSIESRFGTTREDGEKSPATRSLIYLLQTLAYLQLLVMTYVAAQQGWDGIGLLIFITIAYLTDKLVYRDSWLMETWKQRHGITLEAKTFVFTGRVSMLGAIQVFKENSVSCWMDTILVPSTRRDVWLKKLTDAAGPGGDNADKENDSFDPEERELLGEDGMGWVRDNLSRARTGAKVMKANFTHA